MAPSMSKKKVLNSIRYNNDVLSVEEAKEIIKSGVVPSGTLVDLTVAAMEGFVHHLGYWSQKIHKHDPEMSKKLEKVAIKAVANNLIDTYIKDSGLD